MAGPHRIADFSANSRGARRALRLGMTQSLVGARERAREVALRDLADAEVLALVLGTGVAGEPVAVLAASLLEAFDGVEPMARAGFGEIAGGAGSASRARSASRRPSSSGGALGPRAKTCRGRRTAGASPPGRERKSRTSSTRSSGCSRSTGSTASARHGASRPAGSTGSRFRCAIRYASRCARARARWSSCTITRAAIRRRASKSRVHRAARRRGRRGGHAALGPRGRRGRAAPLDARRRASPRARHVLARVAQRKSASCRFSFAGWQRVK